MSKHAKYSPSKLPRIIKCPGSISLTSQLIDEGLISLEQKSSPAAEEGTMLHEVMEKALRKGLIAISPELVLEYELSQEQVSACNMCLDYVQVCKMNIPNDAQCAEFIEAQVSLSPYSIELRCSELDDVYGTADYVLYFDYELIIIDWKFGKGVEVYPDSAQLKAYALACASRYSNFSKITIVVGQPAFSDGEGFKILETTKAELISWAKDILVPALINIGSSNPTFRPGLSTCRWCPVTSVPHACTKRLDMVQEVTSKAFSLYSEDKYQDNLELSKDLLAKAPAITKYFKDLKLYITSQIKHGKDIPGYKIVRGRSTRKFIDIDTNGLPTKFLHWAENTLGLDASEFFIAKPMSAPQAEKFITKQVLKSHPEFYDFIFKPEGALTLTTTEDKRDAVDFKTTSEAFASYIKTE